MEDSDLKLSSFFLGFLLALGLLLDFAKIRLDLLGSLPLFLTLGSLGSNSLSLELSFELSEAAFADAETLLVRWIGTLELDP